MSLKSQLQALATPISKAYAVDTVRRKSLVYENPEKVDGSTCYYDCFKSFEKLCEVDLHLRPFKKTLFAVGTIKMEMCNLLSVHKSKIDEQVSLFLFLMNPHLRSAEAAWAIEWLVYKFQIQYMYVDEFMMLLLPYYETGFFVKAIQLLDFQKSGNQWTWLRAFAEYGTPPTRQDILAACRTQPHLIPFIGTFLSSYAKRELACSTNRIQMACSFLVSLVSGLCEKNFSDSRLAKLVGGLQGVIRRGLRSPELPSFQSAVFLVAMRISMKLKLNPELVMDWIDCILKKTRSGSEWESIRLVNVLMRTQSITMLTDQLSDVYNNLVNELSIVERGILEAEESKILTTTNLNAVAMDAMRTSKRVQKATLIMDASAADQQTNPELLEQQGTEKNTKDQLSCKKILRLNYSDIFADDMNVLECLHHTHAILGAEPSSVCIMRQFCEKCTCPPMSLPGDDNWLREILQEIISKTTSDNSDELSPLCVQKGKLALKLFQFAFDSIESPVRTPKMRVSSVPKPKIEIVKRALLSAFPLVLVSLLGPVGQLRCDALGILKRYIATFTDAGEHNLSKLLQDLNSVLSDSLPSLLMGDCLSALVKTAPDFVRVVFRYLCQQPLKAESNLSLSCWSAVVRLFHTDFVQILVGVQQPYSIKSGEGDTTMTGSAPSFVGWSALLHILRKPSFGDLHMACMSRLDAFTLSALCRVGTPGSFTSAAGAMPVLMGVSTLEAELLDALLELAGIVGPGDARLLHVFSQLLLKTEHYTYCLAKLDAVHLRDSSKSLFVRVASARQNLKKKAQENEQQSEDVKDAGRSRLRALKLVLSALTADVPRLHTDVITLQMSRVSSDVLVAAKLTDGDSADPKPVTPMSSAISRLKNTNKRRSIIGQESVTRAGGSPMWGTPPGSGTIAINGNTDLVFPINSHLFACINAEVQFSRKSFPSSMTTSSSLSTSEDSEEDGDGHNRTSPQLNSIPTSPILLSDPEDTPVSNVEDTLLVTPTASLREQNSACALEALACLTRLFSEGSRQKVQHHPLQQQKSGGLRLRSREIHWENPLIPSESVTAAVNIIFHGLSVFKETLAVQRQGMLCLIEMASLYPAVLCGHLMTLVQWMGISQQFLRLDDVHNLVLLGRLISVAVPALVRVSSDATEAATSVLRIFVTGLTDLPTNLPRRCLAVYLGLVRGLSHSAAPPVSAIGNGASPMGIPHVPGTPVRRPGKSVALQGWLWTSALLFLNTDWPSQETADVVFPLVIDLFNQFDAGIQLSAIHQCLDVFLQLCKSTGSPRCELPPRKTPKRMRLENPASSVATPILNCANSGHASINQYDCSILLRYLVANNQNSNSLPECKTSRKRSLSPAAEDEVKDEQLWRLLSETSALFSSLFESPGHAKRRQDHKDLDQLSIIYSCIVEETVRLLVLASSRATEDSSIAAIARKAVYHLQSILLKLNNFISSDVFLKSVAKLMTLQQTCLTRKALELLLAKLTTLTAKCQCMASLLVKRGQVSPPSPPPLDETLETGLVRLAGQLSEALQPSHTSNLFSGDRSQMKLLHLRLSCLRELALLLCHAYPTEILQILDAFISAPLRWWVSSPSAPARSTSSAAEARSLICLFAAECIARLPMPLISLSSESVGVLRRVHHLLRFALDHASTACRLTEAPILSEAPPGTACSGTKLHSREQHLQAGLTLLVGVLEFCASGCRDYTGTSLIQRLREITLTTADFTSLDLGLLTFVFRVTHLDLMAATQAKVNCASSAIKQSMKLIRRVTRHLVGVTDSIGLFSSLKELFSITSFQSDENLVSGGLEFMAGHSDSVRKAASFSSSDCDSVSGAPNSLEIAYVSQPTLVWFLFSFALKCRPLWTAASAELPTAKPVSSTRSSACAAAASLLSSIGDNYRLQLVCEALRWTVETSTPQKLAASKKRQANIVLPTLPSVLDRLTSVFNVLTRLSALVSAEAFTTLTKNANLINLFVVSLSVLTGQQKSRHVRKLAAPLELPTLLDVFSCVKYTDGTEVDEGGEDCQSKRLTCLQSLLQCIAAWLHAESQVSACLDTAGTDVVLALPMAIVSALDVPKIVETDLVPVVDAFLRAIGGDEALLRPFGAALCAHIVGDAATAGNWRVRLAALRLLKQTFDSLMDSQDRGLGLASCLVSDTLAALSEALEDDRPEVEAAANRLFSDLEAVGATSDST